MIRNKQGFLIQSKHRYKGHKFIQNRDIMIQQPWWFQQYYQQKQVLSHINANNRNISQLARQYQANPSVYTLKQVQKLITDNCQLIQSVDQWGNRFRYSQLDTALYKSQKAMNQNIQRMLTQEIMAVFANKQLINSVNNQLDASFSRSRVQSQNISFSSPNALNNSFDSPDRNRLFQQVNSKIENLNIVLRRMNTMVVGQGDLINRIDENLMAGKSNMVKANEQLQKRVNKQQGKGGEFSCEGKINKAITIMWVVNLVIILLFVLKHIIF